MALDIRGILAAVESHAAASGRFDRVLRFEPEHPRGHEPTNMPGYGVTCAVWMQDITHVPALSGTNTSSVKVDVNLRLYRVMLADPLDLVDPEMVEAVDDLFTAYSGDFTLGGAVMMVDLLGAYGAGLAAQAGYLEQDEHMYRIYTITLPLVLADQYTQTV